MAIEVLGGTTTIISNPTFAQIEPSRMLRGSNGNNIWNFGNISGLGICRGYRE